MLDKDIYDAYDGFRPNDEVKYRMLQNILSEADTVSPGGEALLRKKLVRNTFIIAAVVTAFFALAALAYANGWLGLRDLGMDVPYKDMPGDLISLQGFEGSPEYAACAEWQEFLNGYDTDGAILKTIGNGATGLDSAHEEYGCYTQEMAAKLDEITEKYSLKLLGDMTVIDNDADFFAQAGVEPFYSTATAGAVNNAMSRLYFPDGTLQVEGELTLPTASGWQDPICYELARCMKGSFNSWTLRIESYASYYDWSYTTKSGVPVVLVLSPERGFILADLGSCFVFVDVLNASVVAEGELEGTYVYMSEANLESFADCFDFSSLK